MGNFLSKLISNKTINKIPIIANNIEFDKYNKISAISTLDNFAKSISSKNYKELQLLKIFTPYKNQLLLGFDASNNIDGLTLYSTNNKTKITVKFDNSIRLKFDSSTDDYFNERFIRLLYYTLHLLYTVGESFKNIEDENKAVQILSLEKSYIDDT